MVVFGWVVNFVLAKHALNQFDVGPFNFLRFSGMTVLGWLVTLSVGGVRRVPPEDRRRLLFVALVGFCGYVFGFSLGLPLTSAYSASLLLALVPLRVQFFSSIAERRRPPAAAVVGLVTSATGTALFVASRTEIALGWGDLISLVVAACYGGYLLLNRPLVTRYPPFTLTTYAATIASVPILAITAFSLGDQDWSAVTGSGWAAMAWVIIGPVFVAWSVWSWVQRHLAPTTVAPLLLLVPLVSGPPCHPDRPRERPPADGAHPTGRARSVGARC